MSASLGVWLATLLPSPAVMFVPPEDNATPARSDGGASRRGVSFVPPRDNTAPQRATGGGSRIGFTPPPKNPMPQRATGGGSRIGFTPPPENPMPQRATGGGSRIGFTPPPESPTPNQSANGGSREGGAGDITLLLADTDGIDPVMAGNAPVMTAVVPSDLYGLTVSARPSIMAYLPETRAHTAIFTLKDESQSVVYQQLVPLEGAAGILKISLPADAPELTVGEYYQWFITLQAEDYMTPGSPYVTAWIKRVDVASVIDRADFSAQDGLTQATVLAQAGIWYDAAERLAELHIDPQTQRDTTADWAEFLTSAGLAGLIEQSFL
ncbi:DUF928 domain-containing protein [Leptothoe sp. PORK10 BA2]|uniref:DUF928 domain-containing protein n=1 Tax=Leptothoe sp. PORK10 BA2 TaxID=3110254 RepID=UPI002B1EF557|nr:DUF928 domain-containing protein [Leptothoe sp. PORK10 BA2]MEA5465376.1 DUF928 domain-containing protein [Leptothoe sp. PORK10 BA2]